MTPIASACPAAPNSRHREPTFSWYKGFLAMLPNIVSHAKMAVRNIDPEARQEAVQNVVTNNCAAVAALGPPRQAGSRVPHGAC